jgi:hypothetical protein
MSKIQNKLKSGLKSKYNIKFLLKIKIKTKSKDIYRWQKVLSGNLLKKDQIAKLDHVIGKLISIAMILLVFVVAASNLAHISKAVKKECAWTMPSSKSK